MRRRTVQVCGMQTCTRTNTSMCPHTASRVSPDSATHMGLHTDVSTLLNLQKHAEVQSVPFVCRDAYMHTYACCVFLGI